MPIPDHHQHHEEADQHVEERSEGRRCRPAPAGTDPVEAIANGDEQQHKHSEAEQRRAVARLSLAVPSIVL